MALLELVRQALVDAGVVVSSWPCYIGFAPDDTDQAILLTNTGGFADDTLGSENSWPTFQLFIRAGRLEYGACLAKWQAAYDALHAQPPAGVGLLNAMASGPMQFVDAKNRTCMSVSFRAMVPR